MQVTSKKLNAQSEEAHIRHPRMNTARIKGISKMYTHSKEAGADFSTKRLADVCMRLNAEMVVSADMLTFETPPARSAAC